jgi:RNA polymerase sigma-70 factor (ECF subfamily)
MPAHQYQAKPNLAHCIAACRPELLRSARQLVGGSDADDLIQNTMERALEHATTFQPETNLLAWLRRIMSNLTVDGWRRQNRCPTVALDEGREYSAAPPDPSQPWLELTAADLRAAVAQLPPRFREVFELHNDRGLSYHDIARRLNIPLGTVGTRLLRARLHLRASLTETLAAGPRAAVQQVATAPVSVPAGRLSRVACANDQHALAPHALPLPRRAPERRPGWTGGSRRPALSAHAALG